MPTLIQWEDTGGAPQRTAGADHPLPVQVVSGGGGTSDINLVEIGGVTASVNNGAADNGTLRVTLANDSTGTVVVTQGTSPWVVSATNLDIRDLVFASDKVDVSGSSVTVSGTVAVTQSTSPWVVSGTVAVTQSTSPWVTNDPGLPDTLGQKNKAGSTSVCLAFDHEAILITGTVSVAPSVAPTLTTRNSIDEIGSVQALDEEYKTAYSGVSYNTIGIYIFGTWTGTILFEVTHDDSTWSAINVYPVNGGAVVQSTTANGIFRVNIAGVKNFRVRANPWTSGEAFVVFNEQSDIYQLNVTQPTAANLNATVAQSGTWNIGTVTTVSTVTAVTAVTSITNDVNILQKPSSSSTYAPSRSVSTALEASRVIKASAGNLYTVTGYNSKTSSQFIQIFNSTTVPADGATPIYVFIVAPSSNFSLDFGTLGEQFGTGIAISNSSTAATKTIGSADCWFTARYA